MAEHTELIKELAEVEKLTTEERLKLAKKRRHQQIKKYNENEKKIEKQEKSVNKRKSRGASVVTNKKVPKMDKIKFDSGVVFLEAAARNDINEVKSLLEQGVNPDVANEDGLTALHQCCIDDSEEMLVILLKYGANVNARDSELWTPLHAAATCGHLAICRHLVESKADLLAVNADGNMPYDTCEEAKTLEYIETQMAADGVTQQLIDELRLFTEKKMLQDIKEFEREGNRASEWVDRTGATLLHIGAANGYYDVTSYLLTKRINLNALDNDGWTPAHAAACWGQVATLELLAKNGADLDRKTKNNETLLDLVEDKDIKAQIVQIKKEAKNNQEKFIRENDVRRRSSHNNRSHVSSMYSSNTSLSDKTAFSSSVRRHSMREKHRMSVKEAREEAMFRIAISTDDATAQLPDTVPVTNIDDVTVSVSDNITTIHITDSKPSEQRAETSQLSSVSTGTPVSHNDNKNPTTKRVSAVIKVTEDGDSDKSAIKKSSVPVNIDKMNSLERQRRSNENSPVNGHQLTNSQPNERPVDVRKESANTPLPNSDVSVKRYIGHPDLVMGGEKKTKNCCIIS